ncbi:hypothetical protein Pmani_022573 [Petrolisthes manimaculis]|uniref:PiggyBac transposable element-derived protein 4 C-terminal zinc-ribbon domain-containing protein n=1 Tax=Petrolisthes manimaculis TaxID=1843537 RepID=A0AAE1PE70_9EUCA|nr:hypothetical protein Pmani_022573 [Petrolisthes manimaculis]
MKYRDFHYKVIFQLLEKYGTLTTSERGRRFAPLPDRLAGREVLQRHYLAPTESIGGKRKQILCYVCRNSSRNDNVRKKVTSWCPECKVGLCMGDWYRDFHTLVNF